MVGILSRQESIRLADGKCAFPGCSWKDLQLHHKIKKSQGGSDDDENIMVICSYHHEMIHQHKLIYFDGELVWKEKAINLFLNSPV